MKILHTSDWHLGHQLHGYSRDYEHQAFLDWLAETLEQQQFLHQNGCEFIQGYFYHKPMQAQELANILRRSNQNLVV